MRTSLAILAVVAALTVNLAADRVWAVDFDPSAAIVKIYSKADSQDRLFAGSGMLFQQNGHAYVLTSEHVVLHSNQATRHRIWNQALGLLSANYVISDWGYGIALLEVPSLPAGYLEKILPLEKIQADSPQDTGEWIELLGFPADSQELITSRNGSIVNPAYTGQVLLEDPSLVELSGGHVEFGMSGGPAWRMAQTPGVVNVQPFFAGLVSHQRLAGAQPGEWVPGDDPLGNHALLIPPSVVLKWLTRYFQDPAHFTVRLAREANFQLQPAYEMVQSTDVSFSLTKDYMPGRNCVNVQIYRASDSNVLFDDTQGDLARVASKLRKGTGNGKWLTGRFSLFRTRVPIDDPMYFHPTAVTFQSMDAFMFRIQNPTLEPLPELIFNDWDKADDAMLAFGDALRGFLGGASAGGALLNAVDAIAENLREENSDGFSAELWRLYRTGDFDQLMSNPIFFADWAALKARGLDTKLRDLLTQIRDQLDKMTL